MTQIVEVRSVSDGAAHRTEDPTPHERWVAALQAERAGYVIRGLPGRVAQVDAELARLGVEVEAPPETRGGQRGRQKQSARG